MAFTFRVFVKPVLERATLDIVAAPDLKNQRDKVPVKSKQRDGRIPARKSVDQPGPQQLAKSITGIQRKAVEVVFPALAGELADEDAAARCRRRDDGDGKAQL